MRTLQPFTVRPDTDQPREHQERDRAVQCSGCARTTWNIHAICRTCIDAGRLTSDCDCIEGRRARGQQ